MRPPYAEKPIFPIAASVAYDPAVLDWRNYRFKSLAETVGVDPQQVHLLEITNPSFRALPDGIFHFSNLEHLSIVNKSNYWDNDTRKRCSRW